MKQNGFWNNLYRGVLFGAAVCMASALGGCGGKELLEQVPKEISLQEKKESRTLYLKELESPQKSVDQNGQSHGIFLENLEASDRESFLYNGSSHYAYDSLGESERLWYRDMEQTLGLMDEEVELSAEGLNAGLEEDAIDRIFQCVLYDHPELFYVEGYSYALHTLNGQTVAIKFSGTYNQDKQSARKRKKEIEAAVNTLLREAPRGTDDYAKVKYVYETLIDHTDYDTEAPDNQNIYSVFVNRASVCQGYAKAAQYLLNRMGVFCTLVQGKVVGTGEGHAWNLVRMDGDYYYIDVTWGDISYQNPEGDREQDLPQISYDYLGITTEQLQRTHSLENSLEMPVCTAEKDNYFVRENAFFTEYDSEKLSALTDAAIGQGRRDITLRCGSRECFEKMCDILLEKQGMFEFLAGTGAESFVYTKNEEQWTLTFFLVTSER